MPPLTLHELPFEMVPRKARLLVETTPAEFLSPAQADMDKPIDLALWQIDHPAASYVMRIAGHLMVDAGIADGDLIVVSRAIEARPGDIIVALNLTSVASSIVMALSIPRAIATYPAAKH